MLTNGDSDGGEEWWIMAKNLINDGEIGWLSTCNWHTQGLNCRCMLVVTVCYSLQLCMVNYLAEWDYRVINMKVSQVMGGNTSEKSSILSICSIHHPFWGSPPIFGNLRISRVWTCLKHQQDCDVGTDTIHELCFVDE